ncbi:MAG: DUF488 domain-containing protein [Candidatus Bathyarchaeia archaeon]
MANSKKIFTFGYSGVKPADFIEICKSNGISKVIDIRRFPVSVKEPFYDKDALKSFLAPSKMSYVWLGESLGGFRESGYESYTKTKGFEIGIEALEREASDCKAAILCAERDWTKCHRKYIAEALERRGWMVVHLEYREKVPVVAEEKKAEVKLEAKQQAMPARA